MRVVLPRTVAHDVPTLTSLLSVATPPVTADEEQDVQLTLPQWDTATDLELLGPLGALGFADGGNLSGIAGGVRQSGHPSREHHRRRGGVRSGRRHRHRG